MGKLSEQKMCILMALKMKEYNLADGKSSLQASVLVFFILSTNHTEQSSVELHSFSQLANCFMKTEVGWNRLYDQYVIDFDIDFKSH